MRPFLMFVIANVVLFNGGLFCLLTFIQHQNQNQQNPNQFRPWPKVKEATAESQAFYEVHYRNKAVCLPLPYHTLHFAIADPIRFPFPPRNHPNSDVAMLRAYEARDDTTQYQDVLKTVLRMFGEGIHESLTRTMGA
jgi:hypothetical protein